MDARFILIPLSGFIIGYLTNYLYIVMLFHPRQKIFGIQGIIPKRKEILAKKISEVTPSILPPFFKKIAGIPLIGNKVMDAFKKAVATQIMSLSDDELEILLYSVLKREMKFVVWIGGVLGFLIGLLQLAIALYV